MGDSGIVTSRSAAIERVAVVTGTRAEYGLLRPVIRRLQDRFDVAVILAGMHLADQFGRTERDVISDKFTIAARVDMLFSRDDHAAMAKSIGVGVLGISQAVESFGADAVVVLGDRVEAFAGAIAGAAMNRVVAHLHGGEISRGGLDESMRHAITRFAHIHFAATPGSGERLIRMGEDSDRVRVVGAPGLDTIRATELRSREEIADVLGSPLPSEYVLIVQHPVTTDADAAAAQIESTLLAVEDLSLPSVVIYPNADAGGRRMIEVIERWRGRSGLIVARSLDHVSYLTLLKNAACLVGNSSSGIIEAPAFHVAAVNIGSRQAGRERAPNVIDVSPDRGQIREAIQRALGDGSFRAALAACTSPYGEGHASERIADALAGIQINCALLQKHITY
ncbi:MAG TPA: UDP-N-acetylglucosamine 2-epimerase [Thermoanaerobaculia bacterium]|nr:UDP-N-acetylglucosamine 2-epimerase [Thermoanaerobaculia bacterium]